MTRAGAGPSADPKFSTRAATLLIVAFLVALSIGLGLLIYQGYQTTETRAAEKAIAASQAVEINTGWMVEVADQALRRMDASLGLRPATGDPDTLAQIEDALQGLPRSAKAYIVSPDGHTFYSTDPQLQATDIKDREYFAAPASGQQFYTSGLLISRLNGNQIFVFSRRLERNGAFAGVAIISFDVALLADLWNSLNLETGSTISLVRNDGILIARYPFAEEPVDLSQHRLFTEHLPASDKGFYASAASPPDGVSRMVGYQRVPGTEIIALASVGMSQAIAQFWRNVAIFLGIVVPIVLALAVAALWIISLLQRDARQQAALASAFEKNTMLFREIHHRVKNNLQSMQALVRMQDLSSAAKADLQARFTAMASVHEHMYLHDAYAALDAPTFVRSIAEPVVDAYGTTAKLEVSIDPVQVGHEQATPLALLINEVMTNALKYAFVDRANGKLRLELKDDGDGRATLTIADDGPGFDPSAVEASMGSRLIGAMVRQLGGTFSYTISGGTVFTAQLNLGAVAE